MIVSNFSGVVWTYTVFQEKAPVMGEYTDPRGNHWIIKNAPRETGVVQRGPCLPAWNVDLTPYSSSYSLEPGEELKRFFRAREADER